MAFSTAALEDILAHDPDIKGRNVLGVSVIQDPKRPLHLQMTDAIRSGSLIGVQELINNGYTLHLPGPNFDASMGAFTTKFFHALTPQQWQRVFDCWDYLLPTGVDLNYNCEGQMGTGVPLHCHATHPEAIEYLLNKGADPRVVTSAGHSAVSSWLHGFFGMEKKDRPRAQKALRMLLDAGADPSELVPSHWSSTGLLGSKQGFLDVAYCSGGLRSLVPWLIEQGFDPHATTEKKSVAQKVANKIQKGSTHRHLLAIQEAVEDLESQAQKQRIEDVISVSSAAVKAKKI